MPISDVSFIVLLGLLFWWAMLGGQLSQLWSALSDRYHWWFIANGLSPIVAYWVAMGGVSLMVFQFNFDVLQNPYDAFSVLMVAIALSATVVITTQWLTLRHRIRKAIFWAVICPILGSVVLTLESIVFQQLLTSLTPASMGFLIGVVLMTGMGLGILTGQWMSQLFGSTTK